MNKLTKTGVILMILAGVLTIIAAFVPLWVIDLDAPQYPEGLKLIIGGFAGLSGNLDSVNDLNHYVGMAQLHAEDFWEFAVLPWILIVLGVIFIITGFLKSKKLTICSFILLCLFAVLGFIDFFRWEYNYGHNLSPDAPIKIPGGDFQPPLIGFKQLANFEVFSWPGIGGWILVIAGILVALAIFYEFGFYEKIFKKAKK
jgi:copper chaperone NosL